MVGSTSQGMVLGLVLSLFGASAALAGPVVPRGVEFYFSPRAQTYFKDNLETVLLANEVDLSKNQWDEIRFALKKGKLTSELGRRFSPYFYGFPMNPPKFEIFLKDSNLSVKFKTAGAEVDPAGPKAYGKQKGVVILLRLSSDNVRFQVPQGRLIDLANRDLFGEMGADGIFFATSRRADRPLRVEVPVHIDAGPKGAVMEVLGIRTNLQKAAFELGYAKMLLPKIVVKINEREYVFDHAAFERDIRSRLPELADLVMEAVKSYFEGDGKELIQSTFDDLAKALTIEFEVGIPNLGVVLHPAEARYLADRRLGVVFNTELKDLRKPSKRFPTLGVAEEATFGEVDGNSYDVALSVHPAGLNGVLNRAWASGELKEIEIGKDEEGNIEKVLLPKAPFATLVGQPTPEHAGIHASIAYRVRGWGGILFKYPLPIELDLRVKLEPNAKNEVEVVLEEVDEKTLKIDTSAVWFWPFRTKVDALVREKIAKLNVDLRQNRNLLIAIPTLDSLIGVKLKLTRVRTEAGNLTLYGDFDVKR